MPTAALEAKTSEPETIARRLLDIVAELARQMNPQGQTGRITLDSALDRDLGLDSLGRTELMLRLERAFDVNLPEQTLTAETPRELLRAVLAASGGGRPAGVADLQFEGPGEAAAAPEQATTLLEVLDWHVKTHPDRIHIHLYQDNKSSEEISYAALYRGARMLAAGLLDRGLQPGETVAIMLPTGRGYFLSFYGILLAGGVPVPIYPPVRPSQIEEHLRRHARILANAGTAALITVPEAKIVARLLQAQVPELRHVVTVEDLSGAGAPPRIGIRRVGAEDIAFLQYTSGSTGDPKGVVLSHANLLANLRAMGRRVQARSTDVFVSWLPLYHDMGLIGAAFGSLYFAFPLVVMSPLTFLARPASWLWAIHRYRGTLSAAPNFAYELCLRNVAGADIDGLDLGSLRFACNGAEPVSPDTMLRFAERFAPYGLRPEALAPVYGLAESSVGLALPRSGQGLQVDRIRRDVFMRSGEAVPAAADDSEILRIPACGQPIAGHQLRVVDERGRELPDRHEGAIQFRGPSSTSGYFRNPEATRELFDGEWLNTGDRGYIANGDIYLTGRIKDVIIRGGRNIYPYELEDLVGAIAGIRKGCVAVFASTDPGTGTERLVVVAETRETASHSLKALQQRIREACVDLLGMPPDDIMLAPPHAVLKTSSGKIRRSAVRELYERQALGRGKKAVWWQLARLAGASILPQLRRFGRRSRELAYAGYAWSLVGLLALPAWLSATLLPRRVWRWTAVRGIIRLLVRLTGTRITVRGLENPVVTKPSVLVANHSSYLDAFVLVATIPKNFAFVAKRELAGSAVLRIPLQRLGTVFVERFDLHRSASDAKRVAELLKAGESLAFFPEGTLDRRPGLLPFRMGAFVAAAEIGAPVVPVTIRGARSILHPDAWFPRRGELRIDLEKPILPDGTDWQAAVKLRDAARAQILHRSGEPDLAEDKEASPLDLGGRS